MKFVIEVRDESGRWILRGVANSDDDAGELRDSLIETDDLPPDDVRVRRVR